MNKAIFYSLLFLFLLKNTILSSSIVLIPDILTVSTTIPNIAFAFIIILFSIFYFVFHKINNLKPNNLVFILFFGLLLLQGLYLTWHYKFSWYKYFYDIFRYITLIGIFLLGRYAYFNISGKGLAKWFIILILYHVLTGYWSLIAGELNIVHGNVRLSGEFENIGQFGLLMGFSIILLFMIYKYSGNILNKSLIISLIILSVILLSFNNTMRVFAALLFAFFMYYILYKRRFLYFIFIALFVIGLILVNSEVSQRLASIFTSSYDIAEMTGAKLENSFQWRVMQWYLLLSDWSHNYLFLGTGLGQQTSLHGFITPWGEPFVAHSDFVKLLVETGLTGFIMIMFLFYWLYKYVRNNSSPEEFIMVFMFFFFCLLTGNTLFSNPFQIFIFLTGYITCKNDKPTHALPQQ